MTKKNEYQIQRIGLFGGTFNPIHRGHEQVARDVLQQYNLDHICFVPCALPPHKTQGVLASVEDRLEMVRLALTDQSAIVVSDVEANRSGPSYTIDTLNDFRTMYPENTEFFFMVGMDAFLEIHTWKSFRRLFDQSTFILMTRPMTGEPNLSLPPLALAYTQKHISEQYALAPDGQALVHPRKKSIFLAAVTPVAIAATRIREAIHSGAPFKNWVSPAVSAYIVKKGLYR